MGPAENVADRAPRPPAGAVFALGRRQDHDYARPRSRATKICDLGLVHDPAEACWRDRRPDYHFISRERSTRWSPRRAAGTRDVFGHCYGTPRAPVEAALSSGGDIVSDIDWQGTQQLAHNARRPGQRVRAAAFDGGAGGRLRTRAQDTDEVVRRRMAKAGDEMSHWREYDYIVVNRDLDTSVNAVQAILAAERAPARSTDRPGRIRQRLRGRADRSDRSRHARASAQKPRPTSSARMVPSIPAAESSLAASPNDLRDERSILRRWPKAAAVTRSRSSSGRGEPLRRAASAAPRLEATLGGGTKASAGMSNSDRTSHTPLGDHREPAIGLASRVPRPGARRPPSGTSGSWSRRQRRAQPADQQGRGDVVGQVGDDRAAPAPAARSTRARRR